MQTKHTPSTHNLPSHLESSLNLWPPSQFQVHMYNSNITLMFYQFNTTHTSPMLFLTSPVVLPKKKICLKEVTKQNKTKRDHSGSIARQVLALHVTCPGSILQSQEYIDPEHHQVQTKNKKKKIQILVTSEQPMRQNCSLLITEHNQYQQEKPYIGFFFFPLGNWTKNIPKKKKKTKTVGVDTFSTKCPFPGPPSQLHFPLRPHLIKRLSQTVRTPTSMWKSLRKM